MWSAVIQHKKHKQRDGGGGGGGGALWASLQLQQEQNIYNLSTAPDAGFTVCSSPA